MNRKQFHFIWLFLFLVAFLSVVSVSCADVSLRTDGNLHVTEDGGQVHCNTTDILTPEMDIEFTSDFIGNTNIQNLVRGYTVVINGQLYNYYPQKILNCRVPFSFWHSTMFNDTDVTALVDVNTSIGHAYYTFRLTVNQVEVKPMCETHVMVFNLAEIDNITVTCCEKDPGKHYLSSCTGNYICSVCQEQTERTWFTFTEENSPSIVEHVLDADHHCVANGCQYEEEVIEYSGFSIHLENDGIWTAGRDYHVSLTWDPSNAPLDDITWEIIYKYIYQDDTPPGEIVTIVSSDNNQAVFHADGPGFAYIRAWSSSMESKDGVNRCIEVRETDSHADEFYTALSTVPKNHSPMHDSMVRSYLRDELMVITNNNTDQTNQIIACLENAPELYQELYLWSFYDYFKTTTPDINDSYHLAGWMQVDEFSIDTFFHESGHAIDDALNQFHMSTSDEYKMRLYNALYYQIYQVVSSEVIKAARNTGLTYEQIDEVTEYIMGEEYTFDITRSSFALLRAFEKWRFKTDVRTARSKMSGDFSDKQKEVFDKTIDAMKQIFEDNQTEDGIDSKMFDDMMGGCTNQVVQGSLERVIGHGPLSFAIGKGTRKDYWYNEDGTPTYWQNREAWAEYFSSQLTGHNLENNRSNFSDACDIMDEMAEVLLDAYREKHLTKHGAN